MRAEVGFELQGRFRMPNDEPPGLEGGATIDVHFAGASSPVPCVVTKVVTEGAERVVTFCTPHVERIEPRSEQ